MSRTERVGGSFRDPSGFVFVAGGTVYRQVNESYRSTYDRLMDSGLYGHLTDDGLLVPHREVDGGTSTDEHSYRVIRPAQIPFISYPYEWCFGQLKDAALTTLEVQKRALARGLTLKDASAYNVQFLNGRPVLIDTLSFETYTEGQPWMAYKQFCQHFLAPLALASQKDIRLNQLSKVWIDGTPLDLAVSLLPSRTWLNPGLTMHLRLHSRAQLRYEENKHKHESAGGRRLSKGALLNIIDNLRSTIRRMRWDHGKTAWASYNDGDSYREEELEQKRNVAMEYLSLLQPDCVWDLGANTGIFSRLANEAGAFAVSVDSDPGAVEANYLETKRRQERNLHPLLIDLTNPSADIGWANEERSSLQERCNADCILALALVHHLAIANNVPLSRVAGFFASMAKWLIVEFVPKGDKQVQKLLAPRADIFAEYTANDFQTRFGEYYEILRSQQVSDSGRTIYLMKRR